MSKIRAIVAVCLAFGGFTLLATVSTGCGQNKPQAQIPPPPTAASLPPVPANVPPQVREQARQQMLMSMQSGREAAMRINGAHQ